MSAVDPRADDAVPAVTSRAVPVRTYVTWTALALMTVSSVASLRPARSSPTVASRPESWRSSRRTAPTRFLRCRSSSTRVFDTVVRT